VLLEHNLTHCQTDLILYGSLPVSASFFYIHATVMADTDIVAYNIAAFVTALFLLESGAEKFITAIVARRINVSETTIGLLTAGAEWEEVRTDRTFRRLSTC
jgi:hypothetical protein